MKDVVEMGGSVDFLNFLLTFDKKYAELLS